MACLSNTQVRGMTAAANAIGLRIIFHWCPRTKQQEQTGKGC